VLLEGTDDGVAERAATVAGLLDAPVGDGAAPPWWGRYPFGPGDVAVKVTSAVSRVAATVALAHDCALGRGLTPSVRASASGVTHVGLPGDTPAEPLAAYLDELREATARDGGSVVVLAAPDRLRGELDVWGPVPGLALMRRLKAELDPDRRLAPGRFVGGI
jgi:glycolate oxidase FAD binding subunit